jgi:hypothetical protein
LRNFIFLNIKNSMEDGFQTHKIDIADNKRIRTSLNDSSVSTDLTEPSDVKNILRTEGGESLYNYVEWLGLVNEPDLIVLSSQHHYYYTDEDLKKTNTIVNLKQLNQVKNLSVLLQSIFQLMPPKSNFIGCFADNKRYLENKTNGNSTHNGLTTNSEALEHGIVSKIPIVNMIYNFIDARTNRYMTRRDVVSLFEIHGFKVMDMTELNGLTYFCAQKVRVFTE